MPLPDISRLAREPVPTLAGRFRELGLDRDGIRQLTEGGDDLRTPLAPTRYALYSDEPPAVATRLFFCRQEVDRAEAYGALGPDLVDAALASGVLLEAAPGRLLAPFHLRTVLGLYLFSDYLGSHPEAVMGAGETTAVLYQAGRPARRVESALDLGCGAGTLALLLARDAGGVVGTDINPRAVALARFSARVNGIANAEFLCGDLFAPVNGRKFDLIVSQPPYYPAPEQGGEVFLHGGPVGEELALRVAAEMPAHIAAGGRGLLFTSWPEGRQPPRGEALRVLELRTDRRELHGTRQSIDVIEHAKAGCGWSAEFEVPADSWGFVTSRRIGSLIAAEELLRGGRERLMAARLRMVDGLAGFREGNQLVLRGSPESLIGCTPIDEPVWQAVQAVDGAPDVRTALAALPLVEAALRRGLLVCQ